MSHLVQALRRGLVMDELPEWAPLPERSEGRRRPIVPMPRDAADDHFFDIVDDIVELPR